MIKLISIYKGLKASFQAKEQKSTRIRVFPRLVCLYSGLHFYACQIRIEILMCLFLCIYLYLLLDYKLHTAS